MNPQPQASLAPKRAEADYGRRPETILPSTFNFFGYNRRPWQDQGGAALVIVLAFVVLLTGLVVAFFSRSISNQQSSSANTNQTKVDLLASGAISTLVADLQEEIAAGSTAVPYGTGTFYNPRAGAILPSLVASSGSGGLENVVKISRYQVPFYSGTIYDTANFPPPGDSTQGVSKQSRAANVSSLATSLNYRAISPARWNKPLLMPLTSATDYAPSLTGGQSFVPPDWVLVARDGTNPVTWSKNMVTSGSSTTTVIGRYAYMIYDEGGVLDLNASGYPAPSGLSAPNSNLPLYKTSLGFADLTQIGLTPTQINQIVGWRNVASASLGSGSSMLTGNLPTLAWQPAAKTNYYNFVLSNTTGFLSVSSSTTLTTIYSTDRMFTSRQNMIRFFTQTLGLSGTSLSVLNYLTHFSRDLNQPSLFPDPNRPPTQSSGSGSNDFGTGNLSDPGTGDDVINPAFLKVRVQSTKAAGRFDGSDLKQGEPLVKTRFALSRLAWLTYAGPIAKNATSYNPAVPSSVVNNLKAQGYSDAFLLQGTPQNVYNYFGLSWIADPAHPGASEWVYSHTGTAPVSSIQPAAAIYKLVTLAKSSAPREPDFFELLRASVTMGSLGKAYTTSNDGTAGYSLTRSYASVNDQSVDAAIFQMGANIIDQFDSDSYPTRILANTGLQNAAYKEYRGVEDLPYLYRMREAKIRIQDSAPVTYTSLPALNQALTTAGKAVVLQQPEVWNPHAWNSSVPDNNVRPTAFRLIALTCTPDHASDIVNPGDTNATSNIKLGVQWRPDNAAGGSRVSGSGSLPAQPLTAANSEILFEMPVNSNFLYREPTMLIKPGVPKGSNLRVGNGNFVAALSGSLSFTSIDPANGTPYFNYPNGVTDSDRQYIGVVPGGDVLPLSMSATISTGWINTSGSTPATATPGIVHAEYPYVISGDCVTYRLQYSDASGRWITYDEKFAPLLVTTNVDWWGTAASNQRYQFRMPIGGYDQALTSFDPRTTRFGWHMSGRGTRSAQQAMPPPANFSWLPADAAQNMIATIRPDECAGYVYWAKGMVNLVADCGATAQGWYPDRNTAPMRPGLMSQNNPPAGRASNTAPTLTSGNIYGPGLFCYADPDGVVRRAMAAYPLPSASMPMNTPPANAASGNPLKRAYQVNGGATLGGNFTLSTISREDASRPVMLNRPFRSVCELGYAFSGTPWKNLDFFTPESGCAPLLDVFCVNPAGDSNALVGGKVNLNTRQAAVLQSILAGAYKDEFAPSPGMASVGNASANAIATGLVARTTDTALNYGSGSGPIKNLSELVGKWVGGATSISNALTPFDKDGSLNYAGFSGLPSTSSGPSSTPPNLSYLLAQDSSAAGYNAQVSERMREATLRALSSAGQTRVWNLMIDLVAQTGRYPKGATDLSQFVVEGEQRVWAHLAIDRYTGQLIDSQIEIIHE